MLLWCALIVAIGFPEQSKPLPDPESFRKDLPAIVETADAAILLVHGSLPHDTVLDQYAYKEKKTDIALDSKGNPKHTENAVYEIIRGPENWQAYRRLMSRNGVPQTEKELAKQDSDEAKRVAKERQKRQHSQTETRKAEPPSDSTADDDDIRALYDIHAAWSEPIDGRSVIALTLQPKSQYKPKTDTGKWQQHFAIRAWVTEQGHDVVRMESEVVDQIRIGITLKKGTMFTIERHMINGEIWMPVRTEILVIGSFLFMGGQGRNIEEFSDFKKFSAEVTLELGQPVESPRP